jgi:hypothetical protein
MTPRYDYINRIIRSITAQVRPLILKQKHIQSHGLDTTHSIAEKKAMDRNAID